MFELARLRVRGFRGFVGEQEFAFDHPVVLLCGENHRGKSSTLNAVEWCLFGDDCVGKKTGIRERVDWEIANRSLPQRDVVAVTAEFNGPNGIYKITREQSVGRKRGAQKVTILLPDGIQVEGNEAELLLYALFRSSFQDFMTTVYQHQEAIRAILVQEPRERNEAVDRLLGLSPYREILKGITGAKLQETLKGMESRRDDFRRRSEQAIRTLDNLIKEEKSKAVDEGITVEKMTEQETLHRARDIAEAVRSLADDLGAVDFRPKVPAGFKEIAEFHEWVKTQTDLLWAKAPDVLKQQALAAEQGKLGTLKGNYEATVADEAAKQRERNDFVQKFGDEGSLVKAAQEQQQGMVKLDDQMRKTNAKANLVREAIQYLQEVAPAASKAQCPLCGAEAPQLLSHLQTEWEEKIKAEVEQLELQRKQRQSKLTELQSLRDQLRVLERNLGNACSGRKQCVSQLGAALRRDIGEKDDPLALLRKRLTEIDSELKSTADAIAMKREKISAIYEQMGRLRTIREILSHEQRKAVIESVWRAQEFIELEEVLNKASQLAEDITAIKAALAEASREEAGARIQAAGAALDKYFCCIAKHPAIPGLVMEVTEDRRTGLNSYSFKSKDGTDPTPILSQGDLNCLALSVFLGLSEATGETQRFAFLMLDDPTQSLGPEMKRELVSVLEGIADRRKLIVATPDTEFEALLTNRLTKSKATYTFRNWTESDGPQVIRTT